MLSKKECKIFSSKKGKNWKNYIPKYTRTHPDQSHHDDVGFYICLLFLLFSFSYYYTTQEYLVHHCPPVLQTPDDSDVEHDDDMQ